MIPYRVEFFDKNLVNLHHTNVPYAPISKDYLSPSDNTIEIEHVDEDILKDAYFIRVLCDFDYFGIISKISSGLYLDTITFKFAECMFDREILLDLDLEKSGRSIESILGEVIKNEWMNSEDELDSYPFIFSYPTETMDWKFNLQSQIETGNKSIVNFYQDILVYILEKNRVIVELIPNYNTRKITVSIRKFDDAYNIEADLKSVEIVEFTIKDQENSINKLFVFNAEDTNQKKIFYFHNDGKWDDQDTDRVLPVLSASSIVTPSTDTPFETAAYQEAKDRFSMQSWQNYIELNFIPSDELVKPMTVPIGQPVKIIRDGKSYDSVITGKIFEENGSITLMAGAIRHDLTKIIKKKGV